MSMSRCLIRRYKDATAPIWRAQELASLITHYQDLLRAKDQQIVVISDMLRALEVDAGRESIYGCRGTDCDEVCSGLCYITHCADKHLVASHEALAKAAHALYTQKTAIAKKLYVAQRVMQALRKNCPIALKWVAA